MSLNDTRPAMDFAAARKAMIDSQLRTSGVNSPFVLDRMSVVPREEFVPAGLREIAYIDRAVQLGDGHALASPLFYGQLLAEAQPQPGDRALVLDAGSGYLPELVRPMVGSLDVMPAAEGAEPAEGDRGAGGYTLILIDGAVEHLPDNLARLLAPGGRVVTGIVEQGVTRLAAGREAAGEVALLAVAELGIPRLAAFDLPRRWSF